MLGLILAAMLAQGADAHPDLYLVTDHTNVVGAAVSVRGGRDAVVVDPDLVRLGRPAMEGDTEVLDFWVDTGGRDYWSCMVWDAESDFEIFGRTLRRFHDGIRASGLQDAGYGTRAGGPGGGGDTGAAQSNSSTQYMETPITLDVDTDGDGVTDFQDYRILRTWRRSGESIYAWAARHSDVTAWHYEKGWRPYMG